MAVKNIEKCQIPILMHDLWIVLSSKYDEIKKEYCDTLPNFLIINKK